MGTKRYRNKYEWSKDNDYYFWYIDNQKIETTDCCIAAGKLQHTTRVQVGEMGQKNVYLKAIYIK